MGKPTLYVLAYATDPITTTFVAYEAALMLQHKLRPSVDDWVLPEPAWTIGDYSTQCENDPKTLGAFVIYDVENDSGIVNAVVIQDSFTHLFVRALFISCTQFTTTFDKDKDKEPQGLRSSAITITATGTTSAPPADGQVDFSKQPQTISNAKPYTSSNPPKDGQLTISKAQEPAGTSTVSFTALPSMEVQWVTTGDVKGYSNPLSGMIFAAGSTAAAVGAYLSSRQISQTNTETKVAPLVPGTSTMNGSVTYTNTQMNNNSLLPYGLALLGGALTPLSSLTAGAANQTSLLKQAAARMSQRLWEEIKTTSPCPTLSTSSQSTPTQGPSSQATPTPSPAAAATSSPDFCAVLDLS